MKLSDIIPGGCHTYSKGNDQFPANAPEYLVKGEGCYVWDDKGRKYIDWAMGLRSVILGHAYPAVNEAVHKVIDGGVNFCRPNPLEYELAELMTQIIPCAEMVKFGKSGSDVTSAAVKLARAYTERDMVLIAEENPFISQHDWFIATTLLDGGIIFSAEPGSSICDSTRHYSFENLSKLEKDLENISWDVAAIILDPATVDITKGKLQYIRDLCDKYSIVMILDEVISGFRYDIGGVQRLYGVTPDLATFGKAMANGYSCSALCGKREIMRLGDRKYGNVFLLSGTYFGCTDGLSASIATIKELRTAQKRLYKDASYQSVIDYTNQVGRFLVHGINELIQEHKLSKHIKIKCHGKEGTRYIRGANPTMSFSSPELKTLFNQFMVESGILMPYIAPSFSHTDADIEKTFEAAEYALNICEKAIDKGNVKELLINGHCEKPVFRKCKG